MADQDSTVRLIRAPDGADAPCTVPPAAVKPKRITRVALVAAAWVPAVLLASCGTSEDRSETSDEVVLLGIGEDRLPNESAADVVTFADHVAIVTVIDDEELPVAKEDLDRGEGLVQRSVHMSVDKVLWSTKSARPAPDEIDWRVLGWNFEGDVVNRTAMAAEDSPRFDVGHTYVVALDWEQPNCSKGGRWTTLGGSFNAPYEDETIGVGEFEGQAVAKADLADVRPPGDGLRSSLWGGSADDLVKALRRARPDPELAAQRKEAEADC